MSANAGFTFSGEKIMAMTDAAKDKALKRSAAYVQKIARDHVRHRSNPNIASPPLHSPFDHFGLKRSIVFGVMGNSAYIGPRYIKRGLANVARVHEFGGKLAVKAIDKMVFNGAPHGATAPVLASQVSKLDVVVRKTDIRDRKTGGRIFWIKIRTPSQEKASPHIYRRNVSSLATVMLAHYPPRPYMAPAFRKSLPYIPSFWRNSIRQG